MHSSVLLTGRLDDRYAEEKKYLCSLERELQPCKIYGRLALTHLSNLRISYRLLWLKNDVLESLMILSAENQVLEMRFWTNRICEDGLRCQFSLHKGRQHLTPL